jgi:hypothetical protein
MKNKPLHSYDIIKLLVDFVQGPEPGATGIEINASKEDDFTGVRLMLKLVPAGASPISQWHDDENVTVGRERLADGSTGARLDVFRSPDEWSTLRDTIDKALAAPSETPFQVAVRLKGQ